METPALTADEGDMLLMRSLCSTVKRSVLACETGRTAESIRRTFDALKGAAHPRLIVSMPLTSAQLEYVCHIKPPKALELIGQLVKEAKSLCDDVEFSCGDATRAERAYALDAIRAAVAAGASRISLCDSAGLSLPEIQAGLDAVRNGRVLLISEELLGTPYLRTAAALMVAKCAYPDLYADVDIAKALEMLAEEAAGSVPAGIYYFTGGF